MKIVRASGWLVGILVLVLMSAAAGGCEGLTSAERFRLEATELRDHLRAEALEWDRRLEALPSQHPLRGDVEGALSATRAKLAAVEAAIGRVDLLIQEASNPSDTLTQTVSHIAPLLPAPVRLPLVMGAALLVTLARAQQLKRAMASTARGIQKALEDDPQFSESFRRHTNTFRTIQTATAKRIVDETTGDGFMIRLPI